MVDKAIIRIARAIAEKAVHRGGDGLSGGGLQRRDVRHSGKDGGIEADGGIIIEKAADLLLKRLDSSSVERSGRVCGGLVGWSTVGGWDIDGWGRGREVAGCIEACEDLIDVSWHG